MTDSLKMNVTYRDFVKKIEAVILHKHEKEVVDALRSLELGGFTVLYGKGRGRGPRRIKEGLGRYIEPFNEVDMIHVVVENSKVKSVVSVIANAAHTGSLGDGKIFISQVEDVLDITTLKKGQKYL